MPAACSRRCAPKSDTAERALRIHQAVRPLPESTARLRVPDPAFHVSDASSVTPACRAEIALDNRLRTPVAYGPMLLLNRFDESGRIDGPVVYVINLGERNEVLRQRFADRHWYRYEVPWNRADSLPVLVPYDSAR